MSISYLAAEAEPSELINILVLGEVEADAVPSSYRVERVIDDPVKALDAHDPDVLVLDAARISPELAERLGGPRHAGLPVVVLAGDRDAEAVGLLLEHPIRVLDKAGADLAAALAPIRPHRTLADSGNPFDPGDRLATLRRDAERIAAALAELAASRSPGDARPVTAARIRAHIKARRLRERFLPADLFADPAWDMLLDLAAARLEGTRVSVSSLCIAANVPTTTALRWIKTLVDRGLVQRSTDPTDARRSFIDLSPDSIPRLDACLDAVLNLPGQ